MLADLFGIHNSSRDDSLLIKYSLDVAFNVKICEAFDKFRECVFIVIKYLIVLEDLEICKSYEIICMLGW